MDQASKLTSLPALLGEFAKRTTDPQFYSRGALLEDNRALLRALELARVEMHNHVQKYYYSKGFEVGAVESIMAGKDALIAAALKGEDLAKAGGAG